MTGRAIAAIAATAVAAVLTCTSGGAALFSADPAACSLSATNSVTVRTPPAGGWPAVGRYQPDQVASAATIVAVGAAMGIPVRGRVIAVATAIQESSLRNLTGGDRDSIGLFQQRPSQGWGTPQQLRDPVYASRTFYAKLVTVPNWQHMPLTEAAQAVQISAFPDAYARWETDAAALVTTVSDGGFGADSSPPPAAVGGFGCDGNGGDGQPSSGSVPLPDGWTAPTGTPPAVITAILWALAQRGTPYHFGGDCTDPHSGQPARQCDCSSLMQIAYRTAGITLSRTTGQQIHAGIAIPQVALVRPGDLVFIPGSNGTPLRPGHVGMYIGDGLIIQAPHTGDVVKVTPLSSWVGRIAAIRRIVNA